MNSINDCQGELIPSIARHFRFQWEEAQQAYVLLYPEGMVKLNGSAGEILSCCNGSSTVDEIIDTLEKRYPEAGGLSGDIKEFLGVAHGKQWLQFD
ncbi:pyrroloquinoline quinone biosynthesis peptide chaperone PqqD [Motiliproteus coralliicola]|uniref:PqqA binding protein n=1 Tax=Motiliproteus coralliicola TaxID=2283196 RepID=A0A369WWZ2_9GAMM|nr:pyrroloquinoline quinone biosynthesis peptide chaperone PqqD [Motiliproteus coralliicola]RDE25054.1 pyrroloquinoline quinone biosynthesis peptide chaperone PqqD [Motiliproteus coralliicola]